MEISFYVDEGGSLSVDSNCEIFVLGCSIVQDVKSLRLEIINKENYIRNKLQFNNPNFKGFHASEDHPDIYSEFVRLLREAPFRSYLVFIKVSKNTIEDKEKIYIKMVGALFKNLFLQHKNNNISIFFEENGIFKNSISKKVFKEELVRVSKKIGKTINFNVNICKKKEKLLAITDYVNHIFLKAYRVKIKPCRVLNYKLIKSKIGMIYDIDKGIYYNSKNELMIGEDNNSIIF
ncbi:MAG: hypothetical protein PHY30_00045 [Candidatus Pacebacteria bacterium]|nr:hypothetical protein [Candidatus Paceibacterota bacterium]